MSTSTSSVEPGRNGSNRPARPRDGRWLLLSLLSVSLLATTGWAQPCPTCSPLIDLTAPPHRGVPLGLYPGGTNSPPAAHLSLALDAATDVVPRDATGAPEANGLIGLLSIGMSNTNQEFAAFERIEDVRPGRNPRLIVLDGAVGGQSAEVIVNPAAAYWNTVAQRVAAAGLTADQIQVIWLKEADGAVPDTSFPAHADTLRAHLKGIVRLLKDRFPNLALCYLSSRIYGGYATGNRGEPLTYETGFSVRGVIEEQLNGDPLLNADPDAGPLEAPVLLWGPYLWANGTTPRPGDGLVWNLADLENDRVHPSPSGEAKVAGLLAAFLAAEPTAAPWRNAATGESSTTLPAAADSWVDDAAPAANHGLDPLLAWQNPNRRSYLRFDLGSISAPVFHAKLSLMTPPEFSLSRADVYLVTNTTWGETTITAANAPPFDGGLIDLIPGASRGTALSLDVTDAVTAALNAGPGARLSLGVRLTTGSSAPQQVISREGLEGPRLVLGLMNATSSVTGTARSLRGASIRPATQPFRARGRFLVTPGAAGLPSEVDLFDVQGRFVRTLPSEAHDRGPRAVDWDGRTATGRPAPEGVYYARLRGGPASALDPSCRVVLVRD